MAVRRDADLVAAAWQVSEDLPLIGTHAGWDSREELIAQIGLDRLLGLCHPDVGHPDERRLSRAVTRELVQRHQQHGYWHRSDGALLLPRRATSAGLRYPPDGGGPLANTCILLADDAEAIEITRVPQERELDDAGSPPLGAEDCAVAPIAAAAVLRLHFENTAGRWTYGPELSDSVLPTALLESVLDRADETGAALLLLPEYCSSPDQRARWLDALSHRPSGSVKWLAIGSGPAGGGDENIATLVSRDGKTMVHQPKTQPFDLAPDALEVWKCPEVPAAAKGQPITERAHVHRRWAVVECNRGRLATAVCESFRAKPGSDVPKALASARPTVLLCPVFSQPPRDTCWERAASEPWGDLGVSVVIANSLVVADWQAAGELAGEVACAAARPLDDSSRGHSWRVYDIEPAAFSSGVITQVVRITA